MKNYYKCAAIVWVMCIVGIIAKDKQEAAAMRSVLVDIELTEQQYDAMERMAQVVREDGGIAWSTRDEISLLASGAVIDAATRELHRQQLRSQQIRKKEAASIQRDENAYNPEKFSNPEQKPGDSVQKPQESGSGGRLTKSGGVFYGPSGKETWYNLPMGGVISIMRQQGFKVEDFPYWVRADGCKMLGDYIMIAANLDTRPRGTIVETSLGPGIVCDTGSFCQRDTTAIDIAASW